MIGGLFKSSKLADRTAALAKEKDAIAAARDNEVRRLEALQREARDAAAAELKAADVAFAMRSDELDRALGNAIRKRVYPILAGFVDAPRASAIKLAEVWTELEARALEELGGELAGRHVALAMLASMGGETLARGGDDRLLEHVRCPSPTRLIASGAGPAAVETSLRELEAALARALVAEPTTAPDAKRVEVLQSRGTINGVSAAVAAHDREVKAAREKAANATSEAHGAAWGKAQREKHARFMRGQGG